MSLLPVGDHADPTVPAVWLPAFGPCICVNCEAKRRCQLCRGNLRRRVMRWSDVEQQFIEPYQVCECQSAKAFE